MINFFKENISMIWKCILYHIAMMMFSLVVSIAGHRIGNTVYIIAGIFTIIFYLFLVYTLFIEKGNEDKIKIDGGRLEKSNSYGFLVFLAANSLNLVLSLVAFVTYFFTTPDTVTAANSIHGAFKIIVHYYNAVYMVVTAALPKFPAIYILTVVPGLVVAGVSYILGINGVKHFMPESKKEDRERRR